MAQKMEAPALATRAASGVHLAGKQDTPEYKRNFRRCLYRARPGCALLVKQTILRCGGQVRT
jgi:hypothetical protein